MAGLVTAAVGGAVVGGLASLGGAAIQSHGAQEAANTQASAANHAVDVQQQDFNTIQGETAPWRDAGRGALSNMVNGDFHDFSMADFHADPAYQFDLDQGQKAIQASAAARGGLMSGGTLKDLTSYAQGMASNEYQNAYNRFTNNQNNRFNRYASIAGMGQISNGQTATAGMNAANNIGNAYMGAGNAAAGASIAQGNAFGGALSGLGGNVANTGMTLGMMNAYKPQQPTMTMPYAGGSASMAADQAVGGFQMPQMGSEFGGGSSLSLLSQ